MPLNRSHQYYNIILLLQKDPWSIAILSEPVGKHLYRLLDDFKKPFMQFNNVRIKQK